MIQNLTNPGHDPVDGDLIRITRPGGLIEEKEYRAPVEPEPVDAFAFAVSQKLAALSAKRWQVETGGVTIAGAVIRTDEASQARITGAVMLFDKSPTLTAIDWEAQPTQWVSVDQPTMEAVGLAVGEHVQACFSRMRVLQASILAATAIEDLDAIDIETGWPG